jgi:excisionase family DNA binding protein
VGFTKKEVKEVNNEMVQSLATKLVAEITAQVLANTQGRTSGERVEARLLTVKDAAQYLARSEQAIRHLVFQRDLPVVRSGRNVRLDRRDLDRWIENSRS